MALQLADEFAGKRILDYGCGDGSFLAMLMERKAAPAAAVGAEVKQEVVENCTARFGSHGELSFVGNDELEHPSHQGCYDAVICMEVLEHVLDVEPLLDLFERLLTSSGRLIISVPVETGVPLLVKQAVRRIAGWRGIGDYPGTTSYTPREFFSSITADAKRQHLVRPIHQNQDGSRFHDHKGFNWMLLREKIAGKFVLERTVGSPLNWLPPQLASQVWFVARKRA